MTVSDFVEANVAAWRLDDTESIPNITKELQKFEDIYLVIDSKLTLTLINRKYITKIGIRKKRNGMAQDDEDLLEAVFGEDWHSNGNEG